MRAPKTSGVATAVFAVTMAALFTPAPAIGAAPDTRRAASTRPTTMKWLREAKAATAEVVNQATRLELRCDIAITEAAAGDRNAAIQTLELAAVEGVAQPIDMDSRLYRIVESMLKIGAVAESLVWAEKMHVGELRVYACTDIAEVALKARDREKVAKALALAEKSVDSVSEPSERSSAYVALGMMRAEVGDVTGAWVAVEKAKAGSQETDAIFQVMARSAVATGQVTAGDITGACQTAAAATRPLDRMEVYGHIAYLQSRANDTIGMAR